MYYLQPEFRSDALYSSVYLSAFYLAARIESRCLINNPGVFHPTLTGMGSVAAASLTAMHLWDISEEAFRVQNLKRHIMIKLPAFLMFCMVGIYQIYSLCRITEPLDSKNPLIVSYLKSCFIALIWNLFYQTIHLPYEPHNPNTPRELQLIA